MSTRIEVCNLLDLLVEGSLVIGILNCRTGKDDLYMRTCNVCKTLDLRFFTALEGYGFTFLRNNLMFYYFSDIVL